MRKYSQNNKHGLQVTVKKLKAAMKARQIDANMLCQKTGYSKNTINNILNLKIKTLRVKKFYALCVALDISADYLLSLSKNMFIKRQA